MPNTTDRPHQPGNGSTGPRSQAGKKRSAQNATRHGGCSDKHFILPDEKQEDFDKLVQHWLKHHQCTSEDSDEHRFIQYLAERGWQFRRCEKLFDRAWFKYLSQNPDPNQLPNGSYRRAKWFGCTKDGNQALLTILVTVGP